MAVATQHVLIVGGGLAGPCLALCLARHNIRSTIFELRSTPSSGGGSISLVPNAVQILDRYADVYDRIKASGYAYRRMGAYTEDGEKLGDIAVAEQEENGYPSIRIMRSTVHELLLDAGEKMNDLIEVKYGAKMVQIEEDEKGVTARFEDGSSASGCLEIVAGDILIGADGVHSKVREHVLGADAPAAIFTNRCIVNGFLPTSAAVKPSPDFTFPAMMFTPSGMFMTIPIDATGETLAWGINRPTEEKTREQWRELETTGEAARSAKAEFADLQAQPLRSLLDEADETAARVYTPYSVPDLSTWHTARVCLIGDAAHALPPNGQGSAVAFEDAAILTKLLVSDSATSHEQIFARFQSVRRPRIEALKKASGMGLGAKSGAWTWYLKKWAFRGFFWWKGGVWQYTADTRFDVENVDTSF